MLHSVSCTLAADGDSHSIVRYRVVAGMSIENADEVDSLQDLMSLLQEEDVSLLALGLSPLCSRSCSNKRSLGGDGRTIAAAADTELFDAFKSISPQL